MKPRQAPQSTLAERLNDPTAVEIFRVASLRRFIYNVVAAAGTPMTALEVSGHIGGDLASATNLLNALVLDRELACVGDRYAVPDLGRAA